MLTLSRISHSHSGPVVGPSGNCFLSYFTCILLEDPEIASFA